MGNDTTDSRSRGTNNNTLFVVVVVGLAQTAMLGVGVLQLSSSDCGLLQGKPVLKKENGTPAYGDSTSNASSVLENNVNGQLPTYSDSTSVCDGLSSLSQLGGLQFAWMLNPCQVSMADIVKMGRPQAKSSMPNSSVCQKSFSVKALFRRSSQF